MTQEERRQRREQDTKNAVIVMIGLVCILAALIIGVVLVAGKFLKNDDKPADTANTEIVTETETEVVPTETEAPEPVIDEDTQQAIAVVSGMTLEQKVAQMFVITPDALAKVNGATVFGNTSKQAYSNYPVGGLIYTSKNIKGREQLQDMVSKMKEYAMEVTGIPVFLGVEEEGGSVTKIASVAGFGVTKVDNMSVIGATGDANNAYEAGATIGSYLYDLGFNFNLAPVADLWTNPENTVVKDRSFGSDGTAVTSMVLSVLQGFEENNIYGVVKHFPGHGSTAEDSANGTATNNKTLEELRATDLVPFQNAINAGVDFIMVGHISVPNVTGSTAPSSLSEYMITQVLRNEMGYDGVVITDAMNKKAITNTYDSATAAVTAIAAGADMILMPSDFTAAYEGVIAAVNDGTLTEEQINTAVVRIVKAKHAMYQ